jgi:hypothetical protein
VRREEFEHVLRAAAGVVDADEFVVIGSQAVLGQFRDPPDALLRSLEVDLYPRDDPSRADEIDGALGDGSQFHDTFDYYAHGVGPETAHAPAGWENRLKLMSIPPKSPTNKTVRAWCLEIHDLVLAKLAAGRSHDFEFAEVAIAEGLAEPEQLRLGIGLMRTDEQQRVLEHLKIVLRRVGYVGDSSRRDRS